MREERETLLSVSLSYYCRRDLSFFSTQLSALNPCHPGSSSVWPETSQFLSRIKHTGVPKSTSLYKRKPQALSPENRYQASLLRAFASGSLPRVDLRRLGPPKRIALRKANESSDAAGSWALARSLSSRVVPVAFVSSIAKREITL